MRLEAKPTNYSAGCVVTCAACATIFRAARHERGGVLLIVALCMPVLIGFTGLVARRGQLVRAPPAPADAGRRRGPGRRRRLALPVRRERQLEDRRARPGVRQDAQPAGRRHGPGQRRVPDQLAPLAAPDDGGRSRRPDRRRRPALRGQDDRRQDDRARPAVAPEGHRRGRPHQRQGTGPHVREDAPVGVTADRRAGRQPQGGARLVRRRDDLPADGRPGLLEAAEASLGRRRQPADRERARDLGQRRRQRRHAAPAQGRALEARHARRAEPGRVDDRLRELLGEVLRRELGQRAAVRARPRDDARASRMATLPRSGMPGCFPAPAGTATSPCRARTATSS